MQKIKKSKAKNSKNQENTANFASAQKPKNWAKNVATPEYPEGFLWGASTAGHQVEGWSDDQWSRWEQENAAELARTADSRLSWIPDYQNSVSKLASDPENYISGLGVEHFKRYKQDFKLIKKLGLNSFRFTVEWSRIEPQEGAFDPAAMKHYSDYIDQLIADGIEPVLNLWHWTHPTWFEDKGAFTKRKNIKYFLRFIKKIQPLLEKVTWIVTINEPNNVIWFQYIAGEWPPAEKGKYLKALWTFSNLISAHKQAYLAIKRRNPSSEITTAHSSSINVAKNTGSFTQRRVAVMANYFANTWYLRRIRNYQDVIGFNYYFKNYINGLSPMAFDNPKEPVSDLGWYMEPYALIEVLRDFHKRFPNKRLLVLENGVADHKDQYRKWWIEETLRALDDAVREDIPIAGYLHWSLLDNFEWAVGWWPKFGLVEVDRENNMQRKIRPSAIYYAEEVTKRSN